MEAQSEIPFGSYHNYANTYTHTLFMIVIFSYTMWSESNNAKQFIKKSTIIIFSVLY